VTEPIIIALVSFLGTAIGTLGGILASSKLTNYRLEQLEKKVDKHNGFAEKMPVLEQRVTSLEKRTLHLESYHEEKV
jgi:hypothetical protein